MSKPFTDELTHPPLTEFAEERELIIYLIQLRSLINSNLDFALHWMVTRFSLSLPPAQLPPPLHPTTFSFTSIKFYPRTRDKGWQKH